MRGIDHEAGACDVRAAALALAYMLALPITVPSRVTATTVRPGGATIQDARAVCSSISGS